MTQKLRFHINFNILAHRILPSLSSGIQARLVKSAGRLLLSDEFVQWSGADLDLLIQKISRALESAGAPGVRVGILLPNSAAKALAILAALFSKRIPVPLNPAENDQDLARAIVEKKLHIAIVSAGLNIRNVELVAPTFCLSSVGDIERVPSSLVSPDFPLPPPETALILYTSGSSGEPKGVQLSETALLYNIDFLIRYLKLDSETVSPILLPLCHTMALNTQFLPTFFAGGQSVVFDSAFSLNRIFRSVLESQGTCLSLVSGLVTFCFEEMKRRGLGPASHVKSLTIAGGVIRDKHLAEARELFPNAILYKGYGLTEAIRVSMIDSADPLFATSSSGPVLPGQQVRIVDDVGVPVPKGEIGHLWVKGPNVMIGYEEGPSPIDPQGFLKTCDMASLDEGGYLNVVGRSDGIIKVRGKRVALREFEEAALAVIPEATDVKATAKADERQEFQVILHVESHDFASELRRPERLSAIETMIRNHLRKSTAAPREIRIYETFPRTESGKIKLYELQQRSQSFSSESTSL